MEEKSRMEENCDILETPRIDNFEHENNTNVFSNAFKQVPEFFQSNSVAQYSTQLTVLISNTMDNSTDPTSTLLTPISAVAPKSFNNLSSDINIVGPKKGFLYRTISQENVQKPQSEKSRNMYEQKIPNANQNANSTISNNNSLLVFADTNELKNFQKSIKKETALGNKIKDHLQPKNLLDFIPTHDLVSKSPIEIAKKTENNFNMLNHESLVKFEITETYSNTESQKRHISDIYYKPASVSSVSSSFDDTVTSSDQNIEQKSKKKKKIN
jgi:hypothetical protein